MWTIVNNGKTAAVVYDKSGRQRVAAPGEQILVDVDQRQAARFSANQSLLVTDQDGNSPGPYRVTGRAAEIAAKQRARGQREPPQRQQSERVQITETPKTRRQAGEDLITAYEREEIGYSVLTERAKNLLGSDGWPGGIPKKSVLFGMLRGVTD